ncbi:hypothetical protein OG21DRAFT_1380838, partial [Imleria badia]
GKTYMDTFNEDQYAEKRQENAYYPWASKEEWAFASWLLGLLLQIRYYHVLFSEAAQIRQLSLLFRSAKELRTRAEILPGGPQWVCQRLQPEYPVKRPVRVFYRNLLDCLQALLSHPLFGPHISFSMQVRLRSLSVLQLVLMMLQEQLPLGATLLGVILSSDKTNISVMSGNRVAHPVLISLANIDIHIHSKASLHAYLLLALLPIAKFTHKETRIHGLLQDWLVHQALNIVLAPLKTAATVGVMMNDPVGNLRYCFMPIASWIADMPEEAIHIACSQYSPTDYKKNLKAVRKLCLNGVVDPFWLGWPLSESCDFITPEVLHHFFRFLWDHDVKWCIAMVGACELDFRFSLIQTAVGYRAFDEDISNLKQGTGHDHRAIQRYLIGAVASALPRRFLTALRTLADFCYLAQAPVFTAHTLDRLAVALQEFHDNKDAIICGGVRDNWEIPKLELLQSVVSSIRQSGATMQWSADIMEHAHVDEIKVPARTSNNQDYYNQIARHLDRLDRCFRFDLAT